MDGISLGPPKVRMLGLVIAVVLLVPEALLIHRIQGSLPDPIWHADPAVGST